MSQAASFQIHCLKIDGLIMEGWQRMAIEIEIKIKSCLLVGDYVNYHMISQQ